MKKIKILPILFAFLMIAAMFAPAAGAETPPSDENGETGSAHGVEAVEGTPTVPIKNFYLIGSNEKYYLCSPEMTDSVDSYSFNIPNWMESATILIKAATGLDISSDSADFTEDSGVYKGKVTDITQKSQSYTVKISSSSTTRTLNITIKRSNIPCYFDSISMYKGDSAVNSTGTITDGLTFTLPSGTTGGVTLRVKPRHENEVTVTNLTGVDPAQVTGAEPKTTLELNNRSMRYDYSPTLVEGTNVFRLTVSAGTVVKNCTVTIIVGDAGANTTTTTAQTQATQAAVSQSDSFNYEQEQGTYLTTSTTEKSGGLLGGSKMSPIMWVLIGVIVTIIAGAIIFMIVNLARRDDYDDYDGYGDYGGYPPPPRRAPRRNLAEYVDDDEYYDEEPPVYRGREEYDARYGDEYAYDDTYDQYSSRTQYRDEGRRSRRGGDYYDDDYDNY